MESEGAYVRLFKTLFPRYMPIRDRSYNGKHTAIPGDKVSESHISCQTSQSPPFTTGRANLSNAQSTSDPQTHSSNFEPETVYISSDDEDSLPLFQNPTFDIDPVTETQGNSMTNPISLDSETEEEEGNEEELEEGELEEGELEEDEQEQEEQEEYEEYEEHEEHEEHEENEEYEEHEEQEQEEEYEEDELEEGEIDLRPEREIMAERDMLTERVSRNIAILIEAGMDVSMPPLFEYKYIPDQHSDTELPLSTISSFSLLTSATNGTSSSESSHTTNKRSNTDIIIDEIFDEMSDEDDDEDDDSENECSDINDVYIFDDNTGVKDRLGVIDSQDTDEDITQLMDPIDNDDHQSSSDESGEWAECSERTPEPLPITTSNQPMEYSFQSKPKVPLKSNEKPDWSYVQALHDGDKWVRPPKDILPRKVKTQFPPRTGAFEMLEMLDIYIDSLGPLGGSLPKPSVHVATKATRATRRQNTGKSPSDRSSSSVQRMKPYMPCFAWGNSNWEDWAQFEQGDIVHWPFSDYERDIIKEMVEPGERFKRRLSTIDWVTVTLYLPGRTTADCQRYWIDYKEGVHKVYPYPTMILRKKDRNIRKSTYRLLKERQLSTTFVPVPLEVSGWCNLHTSSTFGEGSGDVFSLGVLQNPKTHILTVVAGSTCDSQIEYNRPGNLRVWRETSDEVQCLPCHNTPIRLPDNTLQDLWASVSDVKVSVDQTLIYSASFDNRAMVWSSDTGKFLSKLEYHSERINQIAVKRDVKENILATGSEDGDAVIWTVDKSGTKGTGSLCVLDYVNMLNPSIECLEFGRYSSENILFAGIRNENPLRPGLVQSFDINTSEAMELYTFKDDYKGGAVSALDVCPDGKSFATGNYGAADGTVGDGYLYIHDYRITAPVIAAPTNHIDVNVVAYSPCLNYVASGNATNEIAVVDVRSPEKPVYRLSHAPSTSARSVHEADIGISGVHWLSNSSILITSGGDGMVKLWDTMAGGKLIKTYQATNDITSLAVNEEAMVIVAGVSGSGGVVHVWGR